MYFKGKWCSEREKEPLFGRFDSFQIGPKLYRESPRVFACGDCSLLQMKQFYAILTLYIFNKEASLCRTLECSFIFIARKGT